MAPACARLSRAEPDAIVEEAVTGALDAPAPRARPGGVSPS